jgi:hypothetical protein
LGIPEITWADLNENSVYWWNYILVYKSPDAKYFTMKINQILLLDVYGYYDFKTGTSGYSEKYNTELKRKVFEQSEEYGEKLDHLKNLRQQMFQTVFWGYIRNPSSGNALGKYNLQKKTFTFRLEPLLFGNDSDGGKIIFEDNKTFTMRVDEKTALEIEDNRDVQINVYFMFNEKFVKKKQDAAYFYYNIDKMRVVVSNDKTGKIYYDESIPEGYLPLANQERMSPEEYLVELAEQTAIPAANGVPEYTLVEKPQVDISKLPKDADGFITIFDGKTFNGWREYNKDKVSGEWTIDNGAIKSTYFGFECLLFAHKFKNFELKLEWKISKGGSSGIHYLAQEVKGQPIYISSPKYQVLDNANHPYATKGINGNCKAGSLYNMIPAVPQNAKPFGEWNEASITVYNGSVSHKQNGKTVVQYNLWTPQWTKMLQNNDSFSQEKNPLAFELLNNLGGANREGYIGLQIQGDEVWYRNIKIKILE